VGVGLGELHVHSDGGGAHPKPGVVLVRAPHANNPSAYSAGTRPLVGFCCVVDDDRLWSRYFFIELFDVFRPFYLGAFLAQPLVRCVPRSAHRRVWEAACGAS
jgi:hypothetical protein